MHARIATAPGRWIGIAAFLTFTVAASAFAGDADTPAAPAGPKYALQYKFRPGEVIRTQVLHRVSLDTTISGTTQTAETTSGSVKVWKITDVDSSGHITLEHSVESVDMRQKLSGRDEVTYNSKTDKQPPPGYEGVSKSIGMPLTVVTIDLAGKVIKRTDKRPNVSPESQNSQMVMPLPAEPVSIGESWNLPNDVTITLEEGETKVIKTRQHYTLEKVANGVATISVATQVLTPVNNPKIQSQLIQRLTQGTVRFDIDAGRMLSQQLELDERVLGFNGPDSSLHYLGRFTEEYVLPPAKTAAKSSPVASKK
jgi:hypothetical protein